MAQYDFGTIDPNTKSGTALASDLNSYRNAVNSMHSGSSAPSYITAGMMWVDTTSADYEVKLYDGAQSITVAIIDATNNVARVAVDPAETSYITSTTSAQIRHVIASTNIFTTRSTGIQFNLASPVIADSNNNELISFTTTASAVNQIGIANSATGGAVTLSAVGSDTNISIALTPKGTGGVGIGTTSLTGLLTLGTTVPRLDFLESGGSAGFDNTVLARDADVFTIQTRNGGTFVSNDYRVTTNASGALTHEWRIGNTERMRIDSAGNVGIGTANPTEELQIRKDNASGLGAVLALANVNTSGATGNQVGIGLSAFTDLAINNASYRGATIVAETSASGNSHDLIFSTSTTSAAPAERLKITSTGSLILTGSTAQKATGTTWSNPSDQRLKHNITNYPKGIPELMQVRVCEWEYNGKGGTVEGEKGIGVIADEVMTILPNTVDTYDAKLNAEDKKTTAIKKFDATEITWLLVKAVQEQQAIITALEARLSALEAQ